MKGNMSKDEFKAWAEQAASARDAAIKQIETAADAETKMRITERLKEALNRQ